MRKAKQSKQSKSKQRRGDSVLANVTQHSDVSDSRLTPYERLDALRVQYDRQLEMQQQYIDNYTNLQQRFARLERANLAFKEALRVLLEGGDTYTTR